MQPKRDALTILFLLVGIQILAQTSGSANQSPLLKQMLTVDSVFFNSLNNCDLKTYQLFLTEDFEFYHDRGGLTKSREAEMKSMASFCGEQRQRQKLRRELIRESVEVSPIPNFGAVETGRHRFYLVIDTNTEKVIEEAKFTNVWQKQGADWKLSRVISYDHRPVSKVQLAADVLDRYVGKYQMAPDRTILVTRNQSLLTVNDGDWTADLRAETNSKFYLDHENVQFEFVQGQKGQLKLVVYENGVQVEQGIKTNK